jgi:uncharacterized protein
MNSSLRDQLLNLGLVTEKQVRQASQQEQQRQFRDRGRPGGNAGQPGKSGHPASSGGASGSSTAGQPGAQSLQPAAPPSSQAARQARDKELNRRRQDKAQRKARMAEIQQIVEQHRLPRLETDDYYSFIDGKKIRRMSVDAARRAQLTSGELVIVRYKGHYAVVPAEIGERVRQRDEQMFVPQVKAESTPGQDETYKDFVVPDDLMW